MPETPKIGFVYPAEGSREWYEVFSSFMNKLDISIYEILRNWLLIPIFEPENFTWNLETQTLSWTDVAWYNPFNGQKINVENGSVIVEDGQIIYVEIIEGGGGQVTVEIKTASLIEIKPYIMILGKREGNYIYLSSKVFAKKLQGGLV